MLGVTRSGAETQLGSSRLLRHAQETSTTRDLIHRETPSIHRRCSQVTGHSVNDGGLARKPDPQRHASQHVVRLLDAGVTKDV